MIRYLVRFELIYGYSDGAQGIVQYRGQNIADFWQTAEFEDLVHFLVWGRWPSAIEKEALRSELVKAAQDVPESVKTVICGFPYVLFHSYNLGILEPLILFMQKNGCTNADDHCRSRSIFG